MLLFVGLRAFLSGFNKKMNAGGLCVDQHNTYFLKGCLSTFYLACIRAYYTIFLPKKQLHFTGGRYIIPNGNFVALRLFFRIERLRNDMRFHKFTAIYTLFLRIGEKISCGCITKNIINFYALCLIV